MLPQAHARVDERHFEIAGPTFSNIVGEFRKLFLSVGIAFIFGKLAELFHLQTFFRTEAVCCTILKAFAMVEKQKSRDEFSAN